MDGDRRRRLSIPPAWTYVVACYPMAARPLHRLLNGIVYISDEGGHLDAFRTSGCGQATCQPLWTATDPNNLQSTPVIANDLVFVSTGQGVLKAFNVAGCGTAVCQTAIWQAAYAGGNYVSAPIIYGPWLMFTCANNLFFYYLPGGQ